MIGSPCPCACDLVKVNEQVGSIACIGKCIAINVACIHINYEYFGLIDRPIVYRIKYGWCIKLCSGTECI